MSSQINETDQEWGRRYLASLPTSPLKPGDKTAISVRTSCPGSGDPQQITVIEGDVIDGMVVRAQQSWFKRLLGGK